MAVTILRPSNREQWLEIRKTGIGSSEVSSILGLNPYQTPYQLWRRKMEMDPEVTVNMPMRLGHLLEDAVAQLWSEETEREVIKASAIDWIAMNTDKPFMKASPDRTFWLPGMKKNHDNKGILECKTTQMPIDPENLPQSWFCQLQWLLGVSETQHGSLAWLSGGRTFGHLDIDLDADFFGWMQEETEKFWVDNIQGGKEPEPVNAEDMAQKYSQHTDGKIVEVGEDILSAYTDLVAIKENIKLAEAVKDELENRLKMQFADGEAISYAGKILASWKTAKGSEKIDTKTLAKVHPALVAQFTNYTPGSRRFLVK